MAYYRDRIQQLENIRSSIKHGEPENVDLAHIRDVVGAVQHDLEILESLRHPLKWTARRTGPDTTRVRIVMEMDDVTAEEMLLRLFIENEG